MLVVDQVEVALRAVIKEAHVLLIQLEMVRPRAILVLGGKAKDALSEVSPTIKAKWWKVPYYALYRQNALLIENAEIPYGKTRWCGDVITIMHPGLRWPNLAKIRKDYGIDGEAVELQALKAFAQRGG